MSFSERLALFSTAISRPFRNGFDAFRRSDSVAPFDYGASYSVRPDRPLSIGGVEKSIVNSIFNRIAIDVSAIDFHQCRLDKEGNFKEFLKTGLEECLTVESNIDQTGRSLIFDIVMRLCVDGVAAVVITRADKDPYLSENYNIKELRVGKIIQWAPQHVLVSLYDDLDGTTKEIWVSKKSTAIIENPLYPVMNEPNSTLKRLIRKLNILDAIDEQSGAGKMDLIIQLPYSLHSDLKKQQAEERRKQIEQQLKNSKYGIAYVDATEKITQLNRSVENNLMEQITYLTTMVYNQLGLAQSIFDGTADEATMLNYNNRTISPMATAIAEELKRKFLSKTARTQGQTIRFFSDPFKLVPVSQIAEIADKLTRNEILSSNEFRGILGYKPSDDPRADELSNKNLNQQNASQSADVDNNENVKEEEKPDEV